MNRLLYILAFITISSCGSRKVISETSFSESNRSEVADSTNSTVNTTYKSDSLSTIENRMVRLPAKFDISGPCDPTTGRLRTFAFVQGQAFVRSDSGNLKVNCPGSEEIERITSYSRTLERKNSQLIETNRKLSEENLSLKERNSKEVIYRTPFKMWVALILLSLFTVYQLYRFIRKLIP